MDTRRVAELLEGIGTEVSVQPSAIQGSPYDRVEVLLIDDFERDFVVVSDREELEDEAGLLVGVYRHYEEGAVAIEDATEENVREVVERLAALL